MTDHVKNQLCARIEELEKEKLELNEQLDIAQREAAEARRQAEGEAEVCSSYRGERDALATAVESWKDCAAQYARNEDFYRGIVRQIGELFGEEARMSDDGSFQDDVLALKVPELVEALAAHVERLRPFVERLNNLCHYDSGSKDGVETVLSETPETSLARLIAGKQAEALRSEAILLYDSLQHTDEQRAISRRIADILRSKADSLERQAGGGEA